MPSVLRLLPALLLVACGDKDGGGVDDDAPSVRIVTPVEGGEFEPGETLVLCLDLDDDGPLDALELTVASDIDGVVWSGTPAGSCGGGDATVPVVLSDDEHTLVVTVEDAAEGAGEDRVAVSPTPNTDPWCAIHSPEDGQQIDLFEGTTLSASVGDEGTLRSHLVVLVRSDVDGTLYTGAPDDDGGVTLAWNPGEEGNHQLAVEVRDARGASATCGVKVEVTRCQDNDDDDWTDCDGDCDDSDPTIHPEAEETWYDGVDQDCAGDSDYDADADGWLAVSHGGADCDDGDDTISPDADETWYDGVDRDCDGEPGDDRDGDGWAATEVGGEDCDDDDATISPDADETWYDGLDEDCDGESDWDADGDGHEIDPRGEDCDDTDAAVFPGADEVRNATDDDCDGTCDEGLIRVGDVVITEIMKDPGASLDDDGEWFELQNASAGDIRLCEGWTFQDSGSATAVLSDEVLVAAGEVVVLGISDDEDRNGGYTPDALYSTDLGLGNGGDELHVLHEDSVIDSVIYLGGGSWPDSEGASLTLDPDWHDADDNDDGTNWCDATSPFGDGDLGTPGTANDEC